MEEEFYDDVLGDCEDISPENETLVTETQEDDLFFHHLDINAEYYTPFLKNSAIYRPIIADGRMPTATEWADFFNESTKNDDNCFTELGVAYGTTKPLSKTMKRIPGGTYTFEPASSNAFERLQVFPFIDKDETILPLGDTFADVNVAISDFLDNESLYREVGTKYKLGLLLYGTPGQGKSVFIRALLKDLSEAKGQDAVIIYMGSHYPSPAFLRKLNVGLKDRLKVFIFEELTSNLSSHYVNWLLTFLDGENSVDKSITIATTNYPETLPENVVNRPSRFDKIYEFLPPNEKDRAELIKLYMSHNATPEEIAATKNYSIADIKELCISVRVNKLTLVEATSVIKKRKDKCSKAFSKSRESQIGW